MKKRGKERLFTHAMPLHKSNSYETKDFHHQLPPETYTAKANMMNAINTRR